MHILSTISDHTFWPVSSLNIEKCIYKALSRTVFVSRPYEDDPFSAKNPPIKHCLGLLLKMHFGHSTNFLVFRPFVFCLCTGDFLIKKTEETKKNKKICWLSPIRHWCLYYIASCLYCIIWYFFNLQDCEGFDQESRERFGYADYVNNVLLPPDRLRCCLQPWGTQLMLQNLR